MTSMRSGTIMNRSTPSKRWLTALALAAFALPAFAAKPTVAPVHFDWFEYTGRDAAFERFFSDRRWRAIVRIGSAHEQDDAALVRSISGRGRVFGCGNAAGAPLRLLSLLDGEERHE